MLHYNIKVYGLVQGVFFRDSTVNKAKELSIKGFVKNLPDSSVYIEAEGDENDLKNFIEWCKEGPPSAQVDDVALEEDKISYFESFAIRF